MKLHRWLELTGMTQAELAALVGCSKSTINRHLKHGRVLDPKVIVRVFFIAMGAVRPDDFYDLENMPPDIAQIMKSPKSRELRKANKRIAPLALGETSQTGAS
jgi:transcriptional regulator with XRE-family HTH domain